MRGVAEVVAMTLLAGCSTTRSQQAGVISGFGLVAGGAIFASEASTYDDVYASVSLIGGGLAVVCVALASAALVEEDPRGPGALDVAGALVLANSPKETADSLSAGAGIERVIARRIVIQRDRDRFDSLAELRAVPGVDDTVIERLIRRGRALGYAR